MKFTTSIILFVGVNQVNAWWGKGHLLVARMGYDLLAKENPAALEKANELLSVYTKNSNEKSYPFVECATYGDDIKGKGGAFQAGWHFVDTPFLDEGGKISDFPFKKDAHNNTEAMVNLDKFINQQSGYQNLYETEQIMNNIESITGAADTSSASKEDKARSLALRLMIHYAGDVHQPLHATARVDKEYPAGDRGGNSFHVPTIEGAYNLHAVYDSVFYEYTGWESLPISSSDWATYGK